MPIEKNTKRRQSLQAALSTLHEGDLIELFGQLRHLKQQAKSLGLFADERELLACPECGLQEDVLADGRLITYLEGHINPQDSGLRFTETDKGVFACPQCGASIAGGA
ncbi:MAG: hypothetical protein IV089_05330 [Thiobacillus sp.]|nr:hypothetical protein [Thiobacillus sp.]